VILTANTKWHISKAELCRICRLSRVNLYYTYPKDEAEQLSALHQCPGGLCQQPGKSPIMALLSITQSSELWCSG